MSEFDDPLKDVAWMAYWEAYSNKCGMATEQKKRVAKASFERWWTRNT